MSTPAVYRTSSGQVSLAGQPGPKTQAALEKARQGQSLKPGEHQLVRDYIFSNLKKHLSTVWKSDDVNETIIFFHGIAGIEAEEKGVAGPKTVAAFDVLAKNKPGYSKFEQYRALKTVAGMYDEKIDPTQKTVQKTATDLSAQLRQSTLWGELVTTPENTGYGSRIRPYSEQPSIEKISEYFKFLGLIDPNKKIISYEDIRAGVRKFNLITRPVRDLAAKASLGGEIGSRTMVTIKKALDLASSGQDWRAPENWEKFSWKKYD